MTKTDRSIIQPSDTGYFFFVKPRQQSIRRGHHFYQTF